MENAGMHSDSGEVGVAEGKDKLLMTPHHTDLGRGHLDKGEDALGTPTKHCPDRPHYLPTELEPLAWIAGTWTVHEPGVVRYPTMNDFAYSEHIEFSYSGQKMLDYKAESWNPEVGPAALMHRESGFLRVKPGSNQVALVIAHNFGVSEILEGTNTPNRLEMMTSQIGRISFATEPEVILTRRIYSYDPLTEELEHVLEMETSRTPLTEHLRIKYKRNNRQAP